MSDRWARLAKGWVVWQQLPLLVALVVLWMLLWGSVSWLNLVTGILLAVGVTRVLYLPPVELSGRFNVIWFVVFLVRFLGQLVVASFLVAFQAFRPRGISRNSIVAVQLVTRSDFIMTVTAVAISVIPGSIVLEADREGGILYLHALGTDDQSSVDAVRETVLRTEARLVRAVGSLDDVRRLRA
jgi:multicomponent Na+:H+ antiporter subunit E